MNEEIQLRAMSVDFAVKALANEAVDAGTLVSLAQQIYAFLKGEAK